MLGFWASGWMLFALALNGCGRPATSPDFPEEWLELERSCQKGLSTACGALGARLLEKNEHSNTTRGLVLLETACGQGSTDACVELGFAYVSHPAVEPSYARAEGLLAKPCSEGHAEACAALGHARGKNPQADPTQVREAHHRACSLGSAWGCEEMGLLEHSDEFSGSAERARQLFRRACDKGRASSCHILGVLMLEIPEERAAAKQLLGAQCEGRATRSCLSLAVFHAPQVGSQGSCKEARHFASRACALGARDGCVIERVCAGSPDVDGVPLLGTLERECSQKVSAACFYWAALQDDTTAPRERRLAAFRKVCAEPSPFRPFGCLQLTVMELLAAESVSERLVFAKQLAGACEAGLAEACCVLSHQYAEGGRLESDPERSLQFRERACSLGWDACCSVVPRSELPPSPATE